MTSVKYTDPERVVSIRMGANPYNRSYGSTYGRKIPTRFIIFYKHSNGDTRRHRLYVMQYGNASSAYLLIEKEELFLDTDTERAIYEVAEQISHEHYWSEPDAYGVRSCAICHRTTLLNPSK